MRLKKIDACNYIIRLEKGDLIISTLLEICKKNKIYLGYFNGIGALSQVELAHYSLKEKKYSYKIIRSQLELVSLYGNITLMKKENYIHSHIVVSNENMDCFGGHLKEGIVSATCEVFLIKINGNINRKHDSIIGLNLLDV